MSTDLSQNKIFVVSSDQHIFQQITAFSSNKYQIIHFADGKTCFENRSQNPLIIFFDSPKACKNSVPFGDPFNGFENNIPVVLIGEADDSSLLDFSKNPQIFHSLSKQEITRKNIHFLLKNISKIQALQNQLKNIETQPNFSKQFVHHCTSMQKVAQLITKASKTDIHCFITGAKGTGKHTSAHLIHTLSNRKNSAFVHCNLSSFAPEDLEKTIFGFESKDDQILQKGKLEEVFQGTLYLEDINILPLKIQAKLLNALQTKSFRRTGGNTLVDLNIRLIVSTKKNIRNEMDCGNFLENLYYLLMGVFIELAPLKDRGNDILLLSNKIIDDFSLKNNVAKKALTKKAKKKLLAYSFPGNIIELQSTLERAIVLANKNSITEADIDFLNPSTHLSFLDNEMTFEEYKSKIIHHYLKKHNQDILLVSHKLDIGKSTIYRMLKSEKEKGNRKMSWLNMI